MKNVKLYREIFLRKSDVLLEINNFEKAINRLDEAVKRAKDDLDLKNRF